MKIDPISSLTGSGEQKPPTFTDREKRDELARECNLRKSFYPSQVRQGRMTQQQAERQKAIMHAIWLDYCARINGDPNEPQKRLDLTDHEAARDDGAQTRLIGVDLAAGDDQTIVVDGATLQGFMNDVSVETGAKYEGRETIPTESLPPQPLNAMAHAGDGDGALREVSRVVAGGGDGEIDRPVRPFGEESMKLDGASQADASSSE